MLIKPGVKLTGIRSEILLAAVVAEGVYRNEGQQCMITSALDGKHMDNSLHYSGQAIDLRIAGLKDAKSTADAIRVALGAEFDVILESDHIHVEYQP